MYHDYFDKAVEDEDEPPLPNLLDDNQELNDSGGDFGVEVESTMTPVSLALSLGFRSGRGLPAQFNPLRHRSGLSPWDDQTQFVKPDMDLLPEHLTKMELHWHQLCGVHSIARSLFTEDTNPHRALGVLIGDEVGLGKTAQSIAFISFLNDAIFRQENRKKLPKILREPVSIPASAIY